ncbi:MAG: type II secretion system F family protein [Pirellulales bacterium]|nr:type II secretion system F family protein [Pirellulales bacterium]
MPDFAYTARNMDGQQVTGTISASTEREATALLSSQDLFPVQVKAGRASAEGRAYRVRPKVMAAIYGQLAALLRSGVPLLRSLDVLREQSSNAVVVALLNDVHDRVEDGATLADAMARHPKAFNELAVSVVRAGGEGGFLEEALDRIAIYTEQQDELRSRVIGALAYPMFLAVVGTVIVNVLVIFFVPKFETLFSRLEERGELHWITKWLIGLSHMMQTYGLIIVAGIILLGFFLRSRLATDEGRMLLDRWRLMVPQASTIYLNLAVARFCRVLGTLLSGGVPIVRSLEISADATGNRILAGAVRDAAENISAGESLAAPLAANGHFPKNVTEMIAVAEESNTLDTVLKHIADSLERETWRRLDLFVRLLEPLMLLILAGVVLIVVIALLLPVLKMSMAI